MADIFDINYNIQQENLNVPAHRQSKFRALRNALLAPLQWLRDRRLGDYKTGGNYAPFNTLTLYNKGDRIVWTDRAVYEAKSNISAVPPTGFVASATYWLKVQDCYIGTDERLKYSSQIIVFCYAINKWFFNPLPNDQIYFDVPLTLGFHFTIYIPAALWANIGLGLSDPEKEKVVRSFADKYVLAGVKYEMTTY